MAGGRLTQARARLTRDRILAAARQAFAERGPDGARIDDLARRARANKQRIYAYFGGKDQLFRTVLAEAVAALAAMEGRLLDQAGTDPAALGRQLAAGYLRFHRESPEFWRLLAWANLGPGMPASAAAGRRPVLDRLRDAYARAQAAGGPPASLAFDTWFVAINGIAHFVSANRRTAAVSLDLPLDDPQTCERLVADAVRALESRP